MRPTLSLDDLQRGWTPRRVGRIVRVLADCTSTNDLALRCAVEGPADGLAVFADHQSVGRGRQGREWVSPRGASILCSVLVEEARPPACTITEPSSLTADSRLGGSIPGTTLSDHAKVGRSSGHGSAEQRVGGRLTLLTAVAACEAIRQATDITPAIKWPNDLRVGGRKLAGILIESRLVQARGIRAWVMGIGVNCLQQSAHFPPEWRRAVTSLEIESAEPIDRAAVGRTLLQRLDEWLSAKDDPSDILYERWLEYAEPLGGEVSLVHAGREYRGRMMSVDPAGGLVVRCDDGLPAWFDPMQTRIL